MSNLAKELQFFEFKHLPHHLRLVSEYYYDMALNILDKLPDNDQRKLCIQRLVESKDCAVRSLVSIDELDSIVRSGKNVLVIGESLNSEQLNTLVSTIETKIEEFKRTRIDADKGGALNT